MDLVKLSAASGFALMTILTVAASGGSGQAQSLLVEPTPELSPSRIQARIDDAFRAAEREPVFALTGWRLPVPAAVPTLPATGSPRPRWPLAATSVDAWSDYIDEASQRFGIPATWVRGVMHQESGGRTHWNGRPITSSAGAMGLMQVMPDTFADMRALHDLGPDPYDPRTNILAGTAYLRAMYDRYGPAHFLAAYNAGPARVDAYLRGLRALPGETRAYTATLQPLLFPGSAPAPAHAPAAVQDLTSVAGLRALAASPSRASAWRAPDPAAAPLITGVHGARATPSRHADAQPSDGLFVKLTATDRRREASPVSSPED